MIWSWLYLAAALVLNAFRPPRHRHLLVPSFFAGWSTGELPLWHILWQLAVTVVAAFLGAFRFWPGWLGLVVALASWTGLAVLALIGHRSDRIFADLEIDPSL